MSDDLKLKVGDVVVRCGKILKTVKLNEDKIFFEPYFDTNNNSGGLTYSFPLKNLTLTNVRKITSKKELNNLFKEILENTQEEKLDTNINARKTVEENNLEQTLETIKTLWQEKQKGEGILPSGKLAIYKKALKQSTKEVAAVRGYTIEKAEKEILSVLGNLTN